jgi:hypothetical protein
MIFVQVPLPVVPPLPLPLALPLPPRRRRSPRLRRLMPLMVVWICSAVVEPRLATIKRSLYRRIDLTKYAPDVYLLHPPQFCSA